ncbi:MAG: hypothetical protein COA57_13000 [Flavobacteriales bacterium]|nr:MAG: hypothetical protein COA57_13000 [Flavobacteriales bacterium]
MVQVEVILPKMGESVHEAIITKWLKKEGDKVEEEESLVEIATDKVDSEVPSTQAGVLSKILVQEGETAKVGQPIAILAAAGNEQQISDDTSATEISSSSNGSASVREVVPEPAVPVIEHAGTSVGTSEISRISSSGKFYSPLVRSIAKTEGVTFQELEGIQGTGIDGRVTKKDILAYLPNREEASQPRVASTQDTVAQPVTQLQSVLTSGKTEIIEMDRMRKLIADHMVMSKQTSPHVTSFVEADVTNLVMWREKVKKQFEEREGEKITFTPIFVEAVVKALKDFPMVNVSVDGTNIIKKKYINIGVAAALPSGNLIVPVIKNADGYNLIGLAKVVNDLVSRARQNKLQPDEIQDGTFTLTNVGTFGNLAGTPIINQPQVAILATGAIIKKPAVIETPSGDTIGIRHMMFMSLSYDHRVVDGFLGGSYLRKVADYLEQYDMNRSI